MKYHLKNLDMFSQACESKVDVRIIKYLNGYRVDKAPIFKLQCFTAYRT